MTTNNKDECDERMTNSGQDLDKSLNPCYCPNDEIATVGQCEDCDNEFTPQYRKFVSESECTTEDLIEQMFSNEEEQEEALRIYRENQTF